MGDAAATEWRAATDELGRTYFYHPRTREVAWEPPRLARATRALEGAQREVRDHARIHAAARLRTCLRVGAAHALQRALAAWRGFAGGLRLRECLDRVELLRVRVRALESVERAEAELDRLRARRAAARV